MKFIFTTSFSILSVLMFAQVPTSDIYFAHDFNGIYAAAIPQNLEPYQNNTTLGQDILGANERALSVDLGQSMKFYNDMVQAGSANGQLTVSLKFAADYNMLVNMEENSYANIYYSGDCFIRILKTTTYFVQVGLNNGNTADGSFGFITLDYNVDPGLISSWTNVTLLYNGNAEYQQLEMYYNGQAVVSASQGVVCSQEGHVIYSNFDLVLGSLDDKPFKGMIDEVYVHNRALTFAEIQAIHNSTSLVSAEEFEVANSLDLYPNPATAYVTLNTTAPELVRVFDVNGGLIKLQTLSVGKNQISIEDLAPGVYIVQCNNRKEKLVKW